MLFLFWWFAGVGAQLTQSQAGLFGNCCKFRLIQFQKWDQKFPFSKACDLRIGKAFEVCLYFRCQLPCLYPTVDLSQPYRKAPFFRVHSLSSSLSLPSSLQFSVLFFWLPLPCFLWRLSLLCRNFSQFFFPVLNHQELKAWSIWWGYRGNISHLSFPHTLSLSWKS